MSFFLFCFCFGAVIVNVEIRRTKGIIMGKREMKNKNEDLHIYRCNITQEGNI